jgi:hypothetical protein
MEEGGGEIRLPPVSASAFVWDRHRHRQQNDDEMERGGIWMALTMI